MGLTLPFQASDAFFYDLEEEIEDGKNMYLLPEEWYPVLERESQQRPLEGF